MALPGKRNLRNALVEYGGNVTETAKHFSVTRRTVYNWIERYEAWEYVKSSRTFVNKIAESNIINGIVEGDVDLSKWWLRHVDSNAFNTQTDEQTLLFNTATLQALQALGVDASEALAQFEALVQAKAQQMAVDHDGD